MAAVLAQYFRPIPLVIRYDRVVAVPRVLVVDDNAVNLELATVLLENEGFDVKAVNDAEAALNSLETDRPDIFVIDVQLPGLSGIDLLSILRSRQETCEVCAVVVTSYAMEEEKERVHVAGCDGCFTKPIDTRSFASDVRRIYETRRESAARR